MLSRRALASFAVTTARNGLARGHESAGKSESPSEMSSRNHHMLPWSRSKPTPQPKLHPKARITLLLQPQDAHVMSLHLFQRPNLHPTSLKNRPETSIPGSPITKHSSESQKWKLRPDKSVPTHWRATQARPYNALSGLHLVQLVSDKSVHDCSSHLGRRTNNPSRSYHWEMVSKGLQRYPLSYAHSISAVHAPLSQSLPP